MLDAKDPIPRHFAGFSHVGTEVVFLNNTDVCISDIPGTWRRRRREAGPGSSPGGLDGAAVVIEKHAGYNEMEHYVQLIRQKNGMTGTFRKSRVITNKDKALNI